MSYVFNVSEVTLKQSLRVGGILERVQINALIQRHSECVTFTGSLQAQTGWAVSSPHDRGSVLSRDKDSVFAILRVAALGSTQLESNGYLGGGVVHEDLDLNSDHWLASRGEVVNSGSYTSTPPHVLMSRCLIKLKHMCSVQLKFV
jgi:hypothetical protein